MRAQVFAPAQDFLTFKRPDGPACLVLDVRLPGLSGLDLQRETGCGRLDDSDHLHHRPWRHPDVGGSDENGLRRFTLEEQLEENLPRCASSHP